MYKTVLKWSGGSIKAKRWGCGELDIVHNGDAPHRQSKVLYVHYPEFCPFTVFTALHSISDTFGVLSTPYMPYSRQDRKETGKLVTLKTFAYLLGQFDIGRIYTYDMHNPASLIVFDADTVNITPDKLFCVEKGQVSFANQFLEKDNIMQSSDVYVAPDRGAAARTAELALKIEKPFVTCDKNRTENGVTVELPEISKQYKTALIVDDIVDGGRSVMELAKKLRSESNIETVNLYVTHGFFNYGPLEGVDGVLNYRDFYARE